MYNGESDDGNNTKNGIDGFSWFNLNVEALMKKGNWRFMGSWELLKKGDGKLMMMTTMICECDENMDS